MKIKWQIPAMVILILAAGCSKDEAVENGKLIIEDLKIGEGAPCLLYTSPSPRD